MLLGAALAGALIANHGASADPIHRIDGNAYWHHDSGWVFPERIGSFVRIGAAQDVAGSRDAVASYATEAGGARVIAAVDVFPEDSAAGNTTLESARAALAKDVNGADGQLSDGELTLRDELSATRVLFTPTGEAPTQALYFATHGEWRVRIRVTVPPVAREVARELDAFVAAQRWDTLL